MVNIAREDSQYNTFYKAMYIEIIQEACNSIFMLSLLQHSSIKFSTSDELYSSFPWNELCLTSQAKRALVWMKIQEIERRESKEASLKYFHDTRR